MRLVFCFLCDFSYEHVRANNLLVRSALAQLVEHALRKRMVVGSSRPPFVINPSPRAVCTGDAGGWAVCALRSFPGGGDWFKLVWFGLVWFQ